MKLHQPVCIFSLVILTACASTHPGKKGYSLKGTTIPIKISAQNIDYDPKGAFQLIEVTLENPSNDWVKIAHTEVVIANPAESKISVVLGKDLKYWAEAMNERYKIKQHNQEMLQTGLLAAGAVAAVAGVKDGNSNLASAGAGLMTATYGWAVADVISTKIDLAEQSDKSPENHLYHPFSLPSQLFLRRWILINKPVGQHVNKLVIEFETVEGEKDLYEISI